MFEMPEYAAPDFSREPFASSPDVSFEPVVAEGVAPSGFHATSIFPEYVKVDGSWVIVEESRMDCVIVRNQQGFEVKEFRKLKRGDLVAVGRADDGSEGIYVHSDGFVYKENEEDAFAFRKGRTRESSYTLDYEMLYELLEYEREKGYVVWVAGPAVVFDHDSRTALEKLIRKGYVHALMAGNALAVHDLEASIFGTALGQEILHQERKRGGHYNHLDVINEARRYGSISRLMEEKEIESGVVRACYDCAVPIILAGSIRDDGPIPDTITDITNAQDQMREHAKRATTLICVATQLHSIAVGNMTPSYRVDSGIVRPVFVYVVDVSEFAVNKLRDRGSLAVKSIITNAQDFLVHLERRLA